MQIPEAARAAERLRADILASPGEAGGYSELFCRLAAAPAGARWAGAFKAVAAARLLVLDRGLMYRLVGFHVASRKRFDFSFGEHVGALIDAVTAEQLRRGDAPLEAPMVFLERRDDPATARDLAAANLAQFRDLLGDAPPPRHPAPWDGRRRLRLGYVCRDLVRHPIGLSICTIPAHHDHDRFEVFFYDLTEAPDPSITATAARGTDTWRRLVGLPYAEQARIIQGDGIDVLVDLSGVAVDPRVMVFLLRPAPVQVSMTGYPGSMGARIFVYAVADRVTVPPEQRGGFSERLIRMPHCFMPAETGAAVGMAATSREAAGLPADGFVMAAFNRPSKGNLETISLWFQLLLAIPHAVLWIQAGEPEGIASLEAMAASAGLAPGRVRVAGNVVLEEHLARLALADVTLDPLGFTGGHSTVLSLASGVPVITCAGRSFAWRMSASVLSAAGLAECTAASPRGSFDTLRQLARYPARLARLKQRARSARALPLFDTGSYVAALEAAFAVAARRHADGLPPADIDAVPPPA